jgi:Fe-S cluster assembly iron-binding protein IscA
MFKLTPTAARTLDEVRRQQSLPDNFGVRVSGQTTPAGELGLQIGFAEAPEPTDTVAEQHGTKVFIAEEVVDPLSDIALDATVALSSNGSAPPELLLRPQEIDET